MNLDRWKELKEKPAPKNDIHKFQREETTVVLRPDIEELVESEDYDEEELEEPSGAPRDVTRMKIGEVFRKEKEKEKEEEEEAEEDGN